MSDEFPGPFPALFAHDKWRGEPGLMQPSKPTLRELFDAAVEITDAAARALFLDEACRDDPKCRVRLEQLLAAEARAGRFLGGDSAAPERERFPEDIGSPIGRYHLRERLGQGGYGAVYLAEQQEPVRRLVALKIIKPGMDTAAVVSRFEAERQTLAVMDHPNIARVFDAGATDAGRPFFVMEYVRGVPITEFCERNGLGVSQRLELFIQVCHGVQHAHQKGIIHRDLKPSNILVTELDGVPTPKVIDFGIAKATEAGDDAQLTRAQDVIGTPAYMSPEQVQSGRRDVDTRSDIFSLGVVLYELMTGVTPFDGRAAALAGLDELQRLIRDTDPPRPSTRIVSPSGESSSQRRQDVQGDVDCIVMKCLEKDRARRYESASALAADLRRHQTHEPITARPPTTLYRLGKIVRRHRVGFAAVTAVVLTLLAAVVVSGWMAVRARRAEREATARAAAEKTARESSEAVSTFLLRVFGSKSSSKRDLKSITVAERLTEAAAAVHDPLYRITQQAELAYAVGKACFSVRMYREAAPLLAEYHQYCATNAGPGDRETLKAAGILALALAGDGRMEEARKLRDDTLRRCREVFGKLNDFDQVTMGGFTSLNPELTRWVEMIPIYEKALQSTNHTIQRLEHQAGLATAYSAIGRHEAALALRKEVFAAVLNLRGPFAAPTTEARNLLAAAHLAAGQSDEAARCWAEASMYNRSSRIDDIRLAALLVWTGHTNEHAAMTARLLASTAGTASAGDANCVAKIACLRPGNDDATREGALQLARRAVQLGQNDSLLPWYQLSLGMAEYRQGDFAAADTALLSAERGAEISAPKHRPLIQGSARFFRAMILARQRRHAEAQSLFTAAAAGRKPPPADTTHLLSVGANQDDLTLWLAWKEAAALLETARP